MELKDLTPELVVSVPCPTCGAAPEKPCLLYSGDPHIELHLARRFYAAETIEIRRWGDLESLFSAETTSQSRRQVGSTPG